MVLRYCVWDLPEDVPQKPIVCRKILGSYRKLRLRIEKVERNLIATVISENKKDSSTS